jgi:hypothetical protein
MNTNIGLGRVDRNPTMAARKRAARTKKTPKAPRVDLPSGSHTGGSCRGCGINLGYWIDYQLCGACMTIRSDAISGPVSA